MAESRANRPAGSVKLIAVSKTKPVEDIELAIAAGQLKFGENYAQEAVNKATSINSGPVNYKKGCRVFIQAPSYEGEATSLKHQAASIDSKKLAQTRNTC